MKRGPKHMQLPEWLRPHYVQPQQGPAFNDLRRSSVERRQHEWVLYCGQPTHRKVMQVEALFVSEARHALGSTCLCCPACGPMLQGVRGGSWYEKALYGMVWGYDSNLIMWFEAKLLKGRYGGLDVYLPAHQLGIMVDGKHHDPRAHQGHHGSYSMDQWRVDRKFDAAVMRRGSGAVKRLLRLHFLDVPVWWQHFSRALHLCDGRGPSKFVLYTPSYGLPDKW